MVVIVYLYQASSVSCYFMSSRIFCSSKSDLYFSFQKRKTLSIILSLVIKMAPSTPPSSASKLRGPSSCSSSSGIALTLGILGVGGIGKEFILQLTESNVLENKIVIAFIANSRKEIRFKTLFIPSEHTRELLETLFDGTNDLAIWAKNLYEVLKIELDIVECASLLERQRIILDDISPSSNTNNALEESSFEENKDDNTKENSLKKGRYCIVDMTSSDDIADLYHVFWRWGCTWSRRIRSVTLGQRREIKSAEG